VKNEKRQLKIENYKKVLVITICILIFFLILWTAAKPLRISLAEKYTNENTLLGFQKAEILTPYSPLVHLKIGQAYEAQGDLTKAKKEFEHINWLCQNFLWKNKSLRGCEEYKIGYHNLRKIKMQNSLKEGDISAAQAALAESMELYPNDEDLKFYYGIILAFQENYQEGIKNLELGIKNNTELDEQRKILLSALQKTVSLNANLPTSPRLRGTSYPLITVSLAFNQINYPTLAELKMQKVIAENPDYRDGYILLGKIYLERLAFSNQGLVKAEEILQKAAEVDPVYPETYSLLAQVYEKTGEKDKANEAAAKAAMLANKVGD